MAINAHKAFIEKLLRQADIFLNGSRPWDIQIKDDRFYDRVIRDNSLGLGESYMDGWWDAERLDELFARMLAADLDKKVPPNFRILIEHLKGRLINLQRLRAFEIGEKHYDIGNDLYERMLDRRLAYTCGYWKKAKTLDEAQEAKLDLICKKLGLRKGMRLLDIGSGWGSFIHYAAEKYGVECVGVTVSKEQAAYANAHRDGLPIETKLLDYRKLTGTFDRIVSIGMFEHVGYKNYRTYMKKARGLLKDDGLFLLQTIGRNVSGKGGDPWILKYIFPNSMLPSVAQIGKASEKYFVMEDWHNFGAYYDTTLRAWFQNFDRHWPELQAKYGDRFYRMWKYYLLSCAGAFRARKIQLWQVVLSPHGVPGGYKSIR